MEIFNDLIKYIRGKQIQAGEQRYVCANNPEENKTWRFASNEIKTSRYNFVTFLPLNLLEQLKQASNIYFILMGIIQALGETFPEIRSSSPITTFGPLFVIWCISFLKNAYDDFGRHGSDRRLNKQTTSVLDVNGKACRCKWEDVKTGDLIRLENNEAVCADILILSVSDEEGLCFIETAELDGETNLKVRQPNIETLRHFGCDENEEMFSRFSQFQGKVVCEAPNNRLERFEGNLEWNAKTVSLENSNIILRGCVLRNTAFVYGLVVYSGHETKLMMNSGEQPTKRTKLDLLTNQLIMWIACCLGLLMVLSYIASFVWESSTGKSWQGVLPVQWQSEGSPAWLAFLNMPPCLLLLSTLIPISLLLSMEIIRMGHSLLINWDLKIYHEETDTPALARNTGLAEELGQIQFIFSDKTGTLTQNEMVFKQCSINGRIYGHADEDGSFLASSRVDFAFNRYADPEFDFRDQELVDAIMSNDRDTVEFFRLLALCHSVMVEEGNPSPDSTSNSSILHYQAQSPDEGALVSAARNFGVVFKSRAPDTVTIEYNGIEECYELLCVLDFDNVRKRMSVIVRKDEKITLYCKGADTIMFELLSDASTELKERTSNDLSQFAQSGLRTLLLASKELTHDQFEQWFATFEKANTEMDNREEKVMATFCEIEKDLNLLGATAIEDKLQDGVPEAIARLAEANINIWVLTGDKQETAINIGYSSLLLTENMIDVFIVDGETETEVLDQLDTYLKKVGTFTTEKDNGSLQRGLCASFVRVNSLLNDSNEFSSNIAESTHSGSCTDLTTKEGFGLVVPGRSLAFALQPEHEAKFLALAKFCKAVICCRVTPLQKAMVVELVKRNVRATTLAIGDGANDVSMIKAAHIGVGISGKEGRQAVLAADYSFAQFRFLERLLLVHGRWSYWRMSKFLNYFFYKNFAFTLVQFWFTSVCGFTSTVLFDGTFVSFYNLFYTSLPVFAMGIFDQDVTAKDSLSFQKLYLPGQQNILFNKKTFGLKVLHGVVSSCVIFFVPFGVFVEGYSLGGIPSNDFQMVGLAVSAILVLVVNLQVGLDTDYWTWMNYLFIFLSVFGYFILTLPISGVALTLECFGSGSFWASLILVVSLSVPPCMGYRWFVQKTRPTLVHSIRRRDAKTLSKGLTTRRELLSSRRKRPDSRRRRPASTRSAFAFSQQKGLGTLLLKGKLRGRLRMNKTGVHDLKPPSYDVGDESNHATSASDAVVVSFKSTSL